MKIHRIPFSLVFVSSLLPLAGTYFGVSLFHVPAALFLITGLIVYGERRETIYIGRIWLYSLGLLAAIISVQIASGRGFTTLAFGGYVLIFAFLSYRFFSIGRGITIIPIIRGISFLNMFFILGMIGELIIVLVGGQQFLTDTFNATASGGYKSYNPADVARLVGLFENQGGLNSVLLGSQIAPMLSLFATIWFISVGRLTGYTKNLGNKIWLTLSILMLILTINGTVLLLTMTAILIYGFFILRNNRLGFLAASGLLMIGLYWAATTGFLLPRLLSDDVVNLRPETRAMLENLGLYGRATGTTLNYYIGEFYTPVNVFISKDLVDQIIGVGAGYLRRTDEYVGGDFSFGAGLLGSGAIWMFGLTATVVGVGVSAIRLPATKTEEMRGWAVLSATTGTITLLWLLSTIHYGQALFNPGGMTFFGVNLALATYCRRRLKQV